MAIYNDKNVKLFKSQPLSCPACRGLYVDPVTDFCGHTYCQLCTEESEFCIECSNHGERVLTFGQLGKLKVNIVLLKIMELLVSVDKTLKIKNEIFKLYKIGDYKKAASCVDEAIGRGTTPNIFLMLVRCRCFLAMGQPLLALRDVDLIIEHTNENIQSFLLKRKALMSLNHENGSTPMDIAHLYYHSDDIFPLEDQHLCTLEGGDTSSNFNEDMDVLQSSCGRSQKTCHTKRKFLKTFCKRQGKSLSSTSKSFRRSRPCHLQSPLTTFTTTLDSLIASNKISQSINEADGESRKCSTFLGDPQNIVTRISHLIKPDDLECPLCLKIFLDPVTTPCGHTFCLDCMYRSLDHAPTCPLCKENLQIYLASRTRSSTKALCWLLETFFGKEMKARRGAREEEMMTLESMSRGERVPIFACTVAFPSVCCPLHIFEPRYKLMIRRCLDSETKQFGMCGLPPNDCDQKFSSIGTMLVILSAKFSRDGRSILQTVGRKRFRIIEKNIRDGYYEGRVEYIRDVPVSGGELEEVMDLMRRTHSKCQAWFNCLCQERMKCIILHYGPFPPLHTFPNPSILPHTFISLSNSNSCPFFRPSLTKGCPIEMSRSERVSVVKDSSQEEDNSQESPIFFPEDGPSWIWYMTAILPVGEEVKRALLSLTSVKCRLKYLDSIVGVALKSDTWK